VRDQALALKWRESCPTLPVTIETPTLDDIWSAAQLKAKFPISCADAFTVALAQTPLPRDDRRRGVSRSSWSRNRLGRRLIFQSGNHAARAVSNALMPRRRSDRQILEAVRRASELAAVSGHHRLRRGIHGLAIVVSTAPLFGLFGTVIGIVNSFPGCGCDKSTLLGAITKLLGEAFVPSALGLLIAITAWWIRTCLTDRVEALALEAAGAADELVRQLRARQWV